MNDIEAISLDEAIKHCLEVAEKYEEEADKDRASEEADNCLQCATDHKQLAEWLQELKGLRGIEQKIYDELAFLYGSPCNFSPQDEVMLMRGRCEDCCGDISDAECWQKYFSVRLGGRTE